MTHKIQVLPDSLINKIAAGEVVERPASVVKELLENSIDAEAHNIRVEIESGGVKLIKVSDDGVGMSPEGAKLSLTRHATSKIGSVDDLFAISTLGFRGEALPSIASVSMFQLVSRSAEFSDGIKISVQGGAVKSAAPLGAPQGTTVEVRELFFNLPARRKFLKSVTTETRQIIQTVTALALANPGIGFELVSDGRALFDYPPVKSLAQRICDAYGENLFGRFLTFDEDAGPVKVAGFLSAPADAKRHRMETRFFVNRRAITSKIVHAAVMSAYGELLPKGCYPQGALFIEISPELIDVNVSPTKNEVRFNDERSLYHILYHTVSAAVSNPKVIPEVASDADDGTTREYVERAKSAVKTFLNSHEQKTSNASQTFMPLDDRSMPSVERSRATHPTSGRTFESEASQNPAGTSNDQALVGGAQHPGVQSTVRPYRLVGFSDLYIVALSAEAIFIVDQHAAHERILYEKALAAFDRSQLVSQKLLFPVNIELDPASYQVAEATMDELNSLGFEIKPFGARSVAIYATPAVARGVNPEKIYRNIIDDLDGVESEGEKIHKKVAQSFACRAAFMAGDRLTEQEMSALVSDLFTCRNPYVCPHGRPTLIKLSKTELEKRFGR
ncbi:MAG: DNA mismatch repair endonuclease MutL [candidate division Zixibacteria bacterium]|nr:DNA mismatch repair endonuclease MutL [candidate division Zixibacteria bacterium]MBU1469112.1 DNA mismatch repair endonuclease MutL [candidate division Zixibacteria bacterium]MBU2624887.1 DNA mismatch repair endonuclease MutL [candidate division Zixibacteria bacterium]